MHRGAIANDIVIRGFQKDNINAFLDGVRLHGACPNRMDPPAFHYDFAEVEDVQILKGPYDLANPGSLGGLVEATSKKPKKGLNADLSVTGGVSNLFDIQYCNYLSYLRDPFATGVKVPENGRNFYVTVRFKI